MLKTNEQYRNAETERYLIKFNLKCTITKYKTKR